MRGATERRHKMAVHISAALVIWLIASPAGAFTCEDVRGLTAEQQNYWSQRLHLSAMQRHVIWASCYERFNSGELHLVRR